MNIEKQYSQMNLNFEISWELNSIFFNDSFSINNLLSFKKKIQGKFINRNIEKNLFLNISEISGFNWKKNTYDVWLVNEVIPMSYPIIINIKHYKKKKDFLFVLIHELIHNNILNVLPQKNNKLDLLELEALVNLITKKILKKLFKINVEKFCYDNYLTGSKTYYKYVWKRVNELETNFDLSKHNLKYYLLKNKKKYKILK